MAKTKFKYEILDEAQKETISEQIDAPVEETDFAQFLPTWEAEHYSHSVLCQKLKDAGEHPTGACEHEDSMAIIEKSIINVRGGNAPDAETAPAA